MIEHVHTTIREGGFVLWALLGLAVMIYGLVADLWITGTRVRRLVESRRWIGDSPPHSARLLLRRYAKFELEDCARIDRRLPFLAVLIGAAPLLGLLGTVAGMLITFGGMASSSGMAPIDTVSTGISRALVTTQAGLVIAVPASFLLGFLKHNASLVHGKLQRQLHEQLATLKSAA